MFKFSESDVEEAALNWFSDLGYGILHGPEIAPGELLAERSSFDAVVLEKRLRAALAKLNADIPEEAREDALRKTLRLENPSLLENNRRVHDFLINGIPVEYQAEGRSVSDYARLIDFERPEKNEWTAINQFAVIEDRRNRRPDVVIFVNGLPLAVIELKNPADENATTKGAFKQIQTYKAEISSLFAYNAALPTLTVGG